MYEYVRGRLTAREPGFAVLEAGGLGYRLTVSASTFRRLPPEGELSLFTHYLLREEKPELYGFYTREERHLFRQLLQVSGVGPAAALGLLSAYEPEALASHIAGGDLAFLVKVKGIGKRTGERILVELRDRFRASGGTAAVPAATGGPRADAVRALQSLGLPRAEAEARVAAVKGDDLPLEEVVKLALR